MLDEPIKTQRLTIRRFRAGDLTELYAYTSDPEVMAFIPEGQFTVAQAREFIAKNSSEQAQAFAVILEEEGRLVGHMLFHPWFAPQTYEIGWVYHSAYHGKGYATEAARALLEYAFEELELHRVIATCQPENVPSDRVMVKLGMRREGHFRRCIYRGGDDWWDEYFYAMLDEDWREIKHQEPR
jgi:ribosomal-protein-alanine N-acetyltransferase